MFLELCVGGYRRGFVYTWMLNKLDLLYIHIDLDIKCTDQRVVVMG